MSTLNLDCAIPIRDQAGHMAIEIKVDDVEHLSDRDRKFLLDVLGILARWTGEPVAQIAGPVVRDVRPAAEITGRYGVPGKVPAVLDGLVRQ